VSHRCGGRGVDDDDDDDEEEEEEGRMMMITTITMPAVGLPRLMRPAQVSLRLTPPVSLAGVKVWFDMGTWVLSAAGCLALLSFLIRACTAGNEALDDDDEDTPRSNKRRKRKSIMPLRNQDEVKDDHDLRTVVATTY
jgi:hypothetical protein